MMQKYIIRAELMNEIHVPYLRIDLDTCLKMGQLHPTAFLL